MNEGKVRGVFMNGEKVTDVIVENVGDAPFYVALDGKGELIGRILQRGRKARETARVYDNSFGNPAGSSSLHSSARTGMKDYENRVIEGGGDNCYIPNHRRVLESENSTHTQRLETAGKLLGFGRKALENGDWSTAMACYSTLGALGKRKVIQRLFEIQSDSPYQDRAQMANSLRRGLGIENE